MAINSVLGIIDKSKAALLCKVHKHLFIPLKEKKQDDNLCIIHARCMQRHRMFPEVSLNQFKGRKTFERPMKTRFSE